MSFALFVNFVNTELPKRPFLNEPAGNLASGKFMRSTGAAWGFELVDASEITGGASAATATWTNNTSGDLVVGNKTEDEGIILYYNLKRGTDKQQGVIELVHDGASVGITHKWHSINGADLGVEFTDADISGDDIRVAYAVSDNVEDVDVVYTTKTHALII